jgi:DNA-binding transcriptional regulator PaaX
MSKYKYYFRKPKSEIVKDVFYWLTAAGAVSIAVTSPYFVNNLIKSYKNFGKYKNKKIYDTFYDLKRQGCLNIERSGHQVYVSLTEKGKNKAGRFQIDDLKINRPKKWDNKWRLVIFDIVQLKNLQRNAFRGKLKCLGFYPLQKSVWVCPYECSDEISLLRDFFGLNQKDIRLITAENIEDAAFLKKIFKIN